MKAFQRLALISSAAVVALSGCVADPQTANAVNGTLGTATAIGGNIFRAAVDSQCRVTLRNNASYRTIATGLTPQQQTDIETSVCGCVSDQAMQNITIVDLGMAASNPATRDALVTGAVARSLSACYSQMVRR